MTSSDFKQLIKYLNTWTHMTYITSMTYVTFMTYITNMAYVI